MYHWHRGEFNLQELIAPTEDSEDEGKASVNPGSAFGLEVNVVAQDNASCLD